MYRLDVCETWELSIQVFCEVVKREVQGDLDSAPPNIYFRVGTITYRRDLPTVQHTASQHSATPCRVSESIRWPMESDALPPHDVSRDPSRSWAPPPLTGFQQRSIACKLGPLGAGPSSFAPPLRRGISVLRAKISRVRHLWHYISVDCI